MIFDLAFLTPLVIEKGFCMYQAREQPVTIQQVFKNQETKIVQIVIVFTRNHY